MYHEAIGKTTVNDIKDSIVVLIVRNWPFAIFLQLLNNLEPDLSIITYASSTLSSLVLFLQDYTQLVQVYLSSGVAVKHLKRLSDFGLIDTPLKGRYSINEVLKAELVVLVRFHELKHALPLLFSVSHRAIAISEAVEHIHLGQKSIIRNIDQSENLS